MRKIIIESPYAGCVAFNKAYLQACIRDCGARGESPYASHQMLTDALDDRDPGQRELGIRMGIEMRDDLTQKCGALSAFYEDIGHSTGMRAAHESLVLQAIPDSWEMRILPKGDEVWSRILDEALRRGDALFANCYHRVLCSPLWQQSTMRERAMASLQSWKDTVMPRGTL